MPPVAALLLVLLTAGAPLLRPAAAQESFTPSGFARTRLSNGSQVFTFNFTTGPNATVVQGMDGTGGQYVYIQNTAVTVLVANDTEFFYALGNNSVGGMETTAAFSLDADAWDNYPLLDLTNNFTINSSSGGALAAAVNLSSVYSAIMMDVSSTLTVRDIALAQVFARSLSKPLSAFAMGPNSTLALQNVVLRTSLTPPLQELLAQLLAAPRPAALPGTQRAHIAPASLCWPTQGLLIFSAPCYSQALVVTDVAMTQPASYQLPGQPFGSYTFTMQNVTVYVDLTVPIDCIIASGWDSCFQQYLAALQNRGISWLQLWVAPLVLGVALILFLLGWLLVSSCNSPMRQRYRPSRRIADDPRDLHSLLGGRGDYSRVAVAGSGFYTGGLSIVDAEAGVWGAPGAAAGAGAAGAPDAAAKWTAAAGAAPGVRSSAKPLFAQPAAAAAAAAAAGAAGTGGEGEKFHSFHTDCRDSNARQLASLHEALRVSAEWGRGDGQQAHDNGVQHLQHRATEEVELG